MITFRQVKLVLFFKGHFVKLIIIKLSIFVVHNVVYSYWRETLKDPYRNDTPVYKCRRWMDELGFYVPSTVFQSFRDDGRVNMKGSVQ